MNNEKGSVALLLLLTMTLLIGMTAMAADIGYVYFQKAKLSDALDAAALAGAQDLMNDPNKARIVADEYAVENGVVNPEIVISDNNHVITINGVKDVPLFFAKALGFSKTTIHDTSKAKVRSISAATGIVPIGVVQQNFVYGQLYDLKYGAGDGANGNYGPLDLGGTGASIYRDNLMYGYQGKLSIGMKVNTETGNMSGPTKYGVDYRMSLDTSSSSDLTINRESSRLLYLPMIDSLDVNGSSEVTIVGFAAFYLEGTTGGGNSSYISGRFIKTILPGDWDAGTADDLEDFGLYTVKLVY